MKMEKFELRRFFQTTDVVLSISESLDVLFAEASQTTSFDQQKL